MKSIKLLWSIIASLTVVLGSSLFFNFKTQNGSDASQSKSNDNKTQTAVLELSQVQMILKVWAAGHGYVILTCRVKNISKGPQYIPLNELAVFDYNNCRYTPIDPFESETINPNISRQLTVSFHVPDEDDIYCIGMSNRFVKSGRQTFINFNIDARCEFGGFEEMKKIRPQVLKEWSRIWMQEKEKWSRSYQSKREPVVIYDEEEDNSSTEELSELLGLLRKEGTNPDNEIEVDLNDYIISNDYTDWNHTELDEGAMRILLQNGIYFSFSKGAWVKERSN